MPIYTKETQITIKLNLKEAKAMNKLFGLLPKVRGDTTLPGKGFTDDDWKLYSGMYRALNVEVGEASEGL